MKNDDSTLVYSSETGGNCKKCNKSLRKCRCKTAPATTHASDGIVRVGRETKGRKGKAVTVVTGPPML